VSATERKETERAPWPGISTIEKWRELRCMRRGETPRYCRRKGKKRRWNKEGRRRRCLPCLRSRGSGGGGERKTASGSYKGTRLGHWGGGGGGGGVVALRGRKELVVGNAGRVLRC